MKFSSLSIAIIIILFSLSSCGNKNANSYPEIIKVNVNDNERFVLKFEIKNVIPLETNDSCLIGDITKLDCFNNKFYILDKHQKKSLMVFDKNGHFIKQTQFGKGPGEVIAPAAFTINKQDSVVILYDGLLSANLSFDLDLNYLNIQRRQNLIIKDMGIINDHKLLVYHHLFNSEKKRKEYIN
ncbi:MAG: 6-bladed beta-propeller, partial [Porphyromonadaceae bacterium]